MREIRARGIRSARLMEDSVHEPTKQPSGPWLARWRRTFRATAVCGKTRTVLVWEHSFYPSRKTPAPTKADLQNMMEFEDLLVQSGEWTVEAIKRLLGDAPTAPRTGATTRGREASRRAKPAPQPPG